MWAKLVENLPDASYYSLNLVYANPEGKNKDLPKAILTINLHFVRRKATTMREICSILHVVIKKTDILDCQFTFDKIVYVCLLEKSQLNS
jgi:hypothetical protein